MLTTRTIFPGPSLQPKSFLTLSPSACQCDGGGKNVRGNQNLANSVESRIREGENEQDSRRVIASF